MAILSDEDFVYFSAELKRRSRIHLSLGKKDFVQSRLGSRLRELGFDSWSQYRERLSSARDEDREWQIFVNALTTNKTDFFREPEHFELLVNQFVKDFRAQKGNHATLHVWSAACSTGEEPYSIAMALAEVPGLNFEILATDLDTNVVAIARNGVYRRERIEEQVPTLLRQKYFDFGSGGIAEWGRVSPKLKAKINFGVHNLVNLLSVKRTFDIIFCRNVLYYFDSASMLEAVEALFERSAPGSLLVLSHSETLQSLSVGWQHLLPSIYVRPQLSQKSLKMPPSAAKSSQEARPVPLKIIAPASKSVSTKTRILILDDSQTMQKLVARMLARDPQFEVVASCASVTEALESFSRLKPDVITLDMNLHHETGLDFLKKLPKGTMVPIVLVTALVREEAPMVLEALSCGASEYVQKPSMQNMDSVSVELCEKIRAVVGAGLARAQQVTKAPSITGSRLSAPAAVSISSHSKIELLAIGASTGGTEAIKEFLQLLPTKCPPILIVQHIPPVFSKAFADRLNAILPFEVKEAVHGDQVLPGRVLVAEGGKQMRLAKSDKGFIVVQADDPHVSGHCPSVDVMFESVAKVAGRHSAGVILTGMGKDGARGLLAMKNAGARTFAQDEGSCVVFGMPKVAIEVGAVECVASLHDLPRKIAQLFTGSKKIA